MPLGNADELDLDVRLIRRSQRRGALSEKELAKLLEKANDATKKADTIDEAKLLAEAREVADGRRAKIAAEAEQREAEAAADDDEEA